MNELKEKFERKLQKASEEAEQAASSSSSSSSSTAAAASAVDPALACELTCSICQELFDHAQTLQCEHSFCEDCIYQWTNHKKVRSSCNPQKKRNKDGCLLYCFNRSAQCVANQSLCLQLALEA